MKVPSMKEWRKDLQQVGKNDGSYKGGKSLRRRKDWLTLNRAFCVHLSLFLSLGEVDSLEENREVQP